MAVNPEDFQTAKELPDIIRVALRIVRFEQFRRHLYRDRVIHINPCRPASAAQTRASEVDGLLVIPEHLALVMELRLLAILGDQQHRVVADRLAGEVCFLFAISTFRRIFRDCPFHRHFRLRFFGFDMSFLLRVNAGIQLVRVCLRFGSVVEDTAAVLTVSAVVGRVDIDAAIHLIALVFAPAVRGDAPFAHDRLGVCVRGVFLCVRASFFAFAEIVHFLALLAIDERSDVFHADGRERVLRPVARIAHGAIFFDLAFHREDSACDMVARAVALRPVDSLGFFIEAFHRANIVALCGTPRRANDDVFRGLGFHLCFLP